MFEPTDNNVRFILNEWCSFVVGSLNVLALKLWILITILFLCVVRVLWAIVDWLIELGVIKFHYVQFEPGTVTVLLMLVNSHYCPFFLVFSQRCTHLHTHKPSEIRHVPHGCPVPPTVPSLALIKQPGWVTRLLSTWIRHKTRSHYYLIAVPSKMIVEVRRAPCSFPNVLHFEYSHQLRPNTKHQQDDQYFGVFLEFPVNTSSVMSCKTQAHVE